YPLLTLRTVGRGGHHRLAQRNTVDANIEETAYDKP
ncbi:MAG: hypothetical protein PWR27_1545, partial [Petroclostridium sp.]|nr:hypothetical protein [Petroclostridium sp.]